MNRLTTGERARIVQALTEGMSLRATSRLTGTSINTVTRVQVALGRAADEYEEMAGLLDLPEYADTFRAAKVGAK